MLCMPRITQAEHAQAVAELTAAREQAHAEAKAIQDSLLKAQEQLAKLEAELHERDEAITREQSEWAEAKMILERELDEERELANGLRDDNWAIGHCLENQKEALRAQCMVLVLLLSGFLAAFAVLAGLRCDLGPEL
jgi:chromosome segregation ATPase